MQSNEIFQPKKEVYPILAEQIGLLVDDLHKNKVFQQIIQKHTNPTQFRKTFKNNQLTEIDGIRILKTKYQGSNIIYEIEGILITQEDYDRLLRSLESIENATSKLRIASFNLAYNVMANKIGGSEAARVQECQMKYSGGWTHVKNVKISTCTKNAADFLSQYNLFGLQEVNAKYKKDFETYMKSLNPNLNFLASYYFGDRVLLTGFDKTVTGSGIMLTDKLEGFPSASKSSSYELLKKNEEIRGMQAIWFRSLNLLFINIHAPHEIDLKHEIEIAMNQVQLLLKKNKIVKLDRVIIAGDFNDDTGKLGKSGFRAFGFEMSVPSSVKTCCTDSNYEYPGDYIFDSKKNVGYYGLPKNYDSNVLMSDHDPIVLMEEEGEDKSSFPTSSTKQKILGESFEGTIQTSGTYVEIQLNIDENLLESMARKYVAEKKLGWNVRKPYAWTDYDSMPHVTLHSSFVKNKGQKVKVKLGEIYHFVSGSTRWVAISAFLPSPFKCEYECHMSIGQERLK